MLTENLIDVSNKKYQSLLKQVKSYESYFYISHFVIISLSIGNLQ